MIKRKIFLLVVIMTLVVSSCSQGVSSEFEAGAPAKLELLLGVNATKALGPLPIEGADAGIKNLTVGVFDGDRVDVIANAAVAPSTPTIKITANATAGDRTYIVVANAPEGSFAGIQTRTAFLAKSIALTQDKSSMLMSSDEASVTLDSKKVKAETINVTRLVARVQLAKVETAFAVNGQYPTAIFEMDKVFMYNAKNFSTVGATPITTGFAHGVLANNNESELSLLDKLSPKVSLSSAVATPYTTGNYFYTFENSIDLSVVNDNNATKIVIGGLFKKNATDAGTYVYYPVVINKPQTGTNITYNNATFSEAGIKRNQTYTINAKIKNIGVDSPDKFINPADLELTITVTPWGKNITQDVEM